MTVDLEPKPGGRLGLALGPADKWIITASLAAVLSLAGWMVISIQSLLTQQAVTNQQLSTILQQSSDIPSIRNDVTELKVRVSNNTDRLRELEQTRRAQ